MKMNKLPKNILRTIGLAPEVSEIGALFTVPGSYSLGIVVDANEHTVTYINLATDTTKTISRVQFKYVCARYISLQEGIEILKLLVDTGSPNLIETGNTAKDYLDMLLSARECRSQQLETDKKLESIISNYPVTFRRILSTVYLYDSGVYAHTLEGKTYAVCVNEGSVYFSSDIDGYVVSKQEYCDWLYRQAETSKVMEKLDERGITNVDWKPHALQKLESEDYSDLELISFLLGTNTVEQCVKLAHKGID